MNIKHRSRRKTRGHGVDKQQMTIIMPPFDTRPHHVKEVRGTKIIVVRRNQHKVCSTEKVIADGLIQKGFLPEGKIEGADHWYIKLQLKTQLRRD